MNERHSKLRFLPLFEDDLNEIADYIAAQRGIPFEMKLPANPVPDMSQLTVQQLDEELGKGYADITAGRTKPAKDVFDAIHKDYGI